MNQTELLSHFQKHPALKPVFDLLNQKQAPKVHLNKLIASARALAAASVFSTINRPGFIVLPDREEALYFHNDLETFLEKKQVLFYPSPFKKPQESFSILNYAAVQERTEVLDRVKRAASSLVIVTYPEALVENVISRDELQRNTLEVKVGDELDMDFTMDFLVDYHFERTDFVYEPGTFSIRGGIIDIFSFAHDLPYRIELNGDIVDSIRSFDPETQLSMKRMNSVTIIPNIERQESVKDYVSILDYIDQKSIVWIHDYPYSIDVLKKTLQAANKEARENEEVFQGKADELLLKIRDFNLNLKNFPVLETGSTANFEDSEQIDFKISPQPAFNKNFELLAKNLEENSSKKIENIIFSESAKQIERIYAIFEDLQRPVQFTPIYKPLHNGFIDNDLRIACYTEHEIFDRYQKYKTKKSYEAGQALTLKELRELQPGDFVTHIDHGIGIFSGLQKIDVGGKTQEAVRLKYKGGDLLYVNINSLHKIARYVGKEGKPPRLNKLGTNTWENLKNKTKKKVKDIARDLIKLYAKRKAQDGFAFMPDTYLQTELEASFIYEDTPDQAKSTEDVKRDMQEPHPMDRLVCGDVGFGKTEIAIRAAFKAVTDSKQVAVLVPTTVLALQHAKTFRDRLKDFPCRVEYVNRFKSSKQIKSTLADLEAGKVDIIIGTHRLLSKDVKFKDLGLLIVDEEQKFGVAAKEKLRAMKVNVDTLTLTATPIPRTLQFSLMGARDLSVINTPPPNRRPTETSVITFDSEIIRDAVNRELDRGGQVFFVHNRIKDIQQIADVVQANSPHARIGIAHGQMEGHQLEEIMTAFVEGFYDVLVSTSIVEAGLDIPNANTIIINQAQNFGLSDLYQLRGRVGRSNKKAYCYLLTPPKSVMTSEARKRLQAIEEFTELGSGFNIAMRDLDIRGAGNLLGGEQSGFIAEIGFEMFQKILDEAVQELKQGEFKDLYKDQEEVEKPRDCQIDSDLEILIPDHYISSVNERLVIYQRMGDLKNEQQLQEFTNNLIDRFGKIPAQTQELLDAVRLKWMATDAFINKINLKKGKLKMYFNPAADSDFFQGPVFGKFLTHVQGHPQQTRFDQQGETLSLVIKNVHSIKHALKVLKGILEGE